MPGAGQGGVRCRNMLPLGLRVLRKVEQIIREEMDRAGALELLMPSDIVKVCV